LSLNFHYRCIDCGREYQIEPGIMLCPDCEKTRKPDEPLKGVLEVVAEGKADGSITGRNTTGSIEDFVFQFLPVEKEYFPSIPVGNTPLWQPELLRRKTDFEKLFLKDDTLNPTGSFKDRASYLVAAFARKHGIGEVTVASTGNAASSMAGVGAASGLKVRIFIPATAPKAKMVQALQYGAEVNLVDGSYDIAFDMSIDYTKKHGGLNRNTAYNPMTIEGKKTVSLELYAQLGDVPEYMFVPTGDGVILSGVFKGFKDLLSLGIIDKMPTVYSVQAEGSSAICRALSTGSFGKPLPSKTIADSIAVDVPRGGYYALRSLKEFGGRCITVSDDEILAAQHELASNAGLFAEPASSAAYAGFLKASRSLPRDSKVVLLITGSGLKDIEAAMKGVKLP